MIDLKGYRVGLHGRAGQKYGRYPCENLDEVVDYIQSSSDFRVVLALVEYPTLGAEPNEIVWVLLAEVPIGPDYRWDCDPSMMVEELTALDPHISANGNNWTSIPLADLGSCAGCTYHTNYYNPEIDFVGY